MKTPIKKTLPQMQVKHLRQLFVSMLNHHSKGEYGSSSSPSSPDPPDVNTGGMTLISTSGDTYSFFSTMHFPPLLVFFNNRTSKLVCCDTIYYHRFYYVYYVLAISRRSCKNCVHIAKYSVANIFNTVYRDCVHK